MKNEENKEDQKQQQQPNLNRNGSGSVVHPSLHIQQQLQVQ